MDTVFREPVLVRVAGQDGRTELFEIKTVREGLLALNRSGLGGFDLVSDDWQRAALTLQNAIRHPCQECADKAHAALLALARRTRARRTVCL